MAFESLLDEALEAWQFTRAGVIEEVENLSEAELKFRPHPESRTPAELVIHLVQSGLMMAGELTRPNGSFRRQPFPAFIKEYAGHIQPTTKKRELVRMLKRTHVEAERKIRAAGELQMVQLITRFDSKLGTRLAWMNHAIAHEEYHRGQLALYARLVGRVPALTRRIRGG